MHRLNELATRLTQAELQEVEDFAEFLLHRQEKKTIRPSLAQMPAKTVSFEGWAGCMAGIEPEKSDKQLVREARDEILQKHDR